MSSFLGLKSYLFVPICRSACKFLSIRHFEFIINEIPTGLETVGSYSLRVNILHRDPNINILFHFFLKTFASYFAYWILNFLYLSFMLSTFWWFCFKFCSKLIFENWGLKWKWWASCGRRRRTRDCQKLFNRKKTTRDQESKTSCKIIKNFL